MPEFDIAVQPAQMPPLQIEMQELDNMLDRLANEVQRLADNHNYLMRPPEPSPGGSLASVEGDSPPDWSPLTTRIVGFRRRLSASCDELSRLQERLDR